MTESISNVPVLGGLKKIIEAPFKLVGNTLQTAGSVLNGDTEGFKNGLGGAVNSVFDVPDGALGVLQDGINALRPRRQNTGYVPNRPQQYVGPIPQVEPQPVAYDPALQPPKEYIIPELVIKTVEPKKEADNTAKAENANKKLNGTIAKADDADKKLNDTIKKAQEENARLEQNIAKAKDIPATPVAPEPPKAEPPVAKAPQKPEENKTNWKKWLLIGGGIVATAGLAFLFRGKISGAFKKLFGAGASAAGSATANATGGATSALAGAADDVVNTATGLRTPEEIKVMNKARVKRMLKAERLEAAKKAREARKLANAEKVRIKEAGEKLEAINKKETKKIIERAKRKHAKKLAKIQYAQAKKRNLELTKAQDLANKTELDKLREDIIARSKSKAQERIVGLRTPEEIKTINKVRAKRMLKAERLEAAKKAREARKLANAEKVRIKEAGEKLEAINKKETKKIVERAKRKHAKKLAKIQYAQAKKRNLELTKAQDLANKAELDKLREDIIARSQVNPTPNLKDLNVTVNGQIDAGNVFKVQGKVEPGLVITPNSAPKAPKTRTFYEALSGSDKKAFDDLGKKLKAQEMDAMWDAKKAQELAEQAKIKAQTEKEIAEHFANPPKAPKAPKAPAATIPPVTNPVKKPVAVTPATLNQKPMGTLEELLPDEAKKLDAVVTSNPVVLTAKKGAQFRLGDKVKVRLNMNGVPKKDQKALQDSFRSLMGGKEAALWKNHTQIELDLTSSNLGQIKKLQKHLEIVAA